MAGVRAVAIIVQKVTEKIHQEIQAFPFLHFSSANLLCSTQLHQFWQKKGQKCPKEQTFLLTHYCLKGPPPQHNPKSGTPKITKNTNSRTGLLSWAHLLCSTQLHLFQDKKQQKSPQGKTFLLRHYSNSRQAAHSKLGTHPKKSPKIQKHIIFSLLSWLHLLCSITRHLFQEKKPEKRPKGTLFLLSHY